ncbi:hypothetical protein ZWY2020_004194 [Hordeum vulgare]|nr:hypothetical protein ZWY2020_004194 [Hordeum vulgare]
MGDYLARFIEHVHVVYTGEWKPLPQKRSASSHGSVTIDSIYYYATMAALPLAMAEVYDANSHLITGGELRALQPIFKIYGRRQFFTGPIMTLKVFEDNVVVREFLEEKG